MSEQNKAAVRKVLETFNSGDFDVLDEVMAEDVVDHDPYNAHASEGREGLKRSIAGYREMFPDLRLTIEDQIAEGDKVVTRWSATGTHQETGKTSAVTGMGIDRLEDGKVVEGWANWDTLGMMQQIGAIPEPQAAQA